MVKLLRRLVLFGTLLYAVSAIAGAVNSVQVSQGGSTSPLAVVLPTCVPGKALSYPSNNTFSCVDLPATPTPTTSATPTASPTSTPITSTTAPFWTRWYGLGADGAGPASGGIGTVGVKQYTSWTCTGAITFTAGLIVYSQGTIALNSGCTITENTGRSSTGDIGGAGGSGGSGAANSVASIASAPYNSILTAPLFHAISAAAAASSAGAGNDGGAIGTPAVYSMMAVPPPPGFSGGGIGSAGGSTGGAAGNGGFGLILIAPTITLASGVTIDTSGFPGVAPAANSTGAGGGGGAGPIEMYAQSFTDSGATYKYGGGPGGAITQPSVQATGGGCDTTGCGTDAVLTVTGLTTGGLDATKITITNAGSGYKTAPTCRVNAGGSGLIGTPACHFTISAGAIASIVIDTAGSGGTLTTYTTTFIGGYGANGWYMQKLIQ